MLYIAAVRYYMAHVSVVPLVVDATVAINETHSSVLFCLCTTSKCPATSSSFTTFAWEVVWVFKFLLHLLAKCVALAI